MSTELSNIIEGCKNQDRLLQKSLYAHCYNQMMKVCSRYTEDEETAASMYNDAMLKVFKNIHNYSEEGKIIGWIKTITVNTCIDYVRKKSPILIKELNEKYNNNVVIDNDIIAKMSNAEIKQIVNILPKNEALVFNLFIYEQYSHNEIAELLNIPAGTSRYYLSQARSLLKTMIENKIYSLNNL